MRKISKLLCGLAAGAALAAAGAARADITWFVQGTFDDGSLLTGEFTLDQNGFIETQSEVVTARDDYKGSNSSLNNNARIVTFSRTPGFADEVRLVFVNDLTLPTSSPDPLVGVVGPDGGPSYECRGSGFCFSGDTARGGTYHFLVSGEASTTPFAAVPEPAGWALMIAGMGLTGSVLRRRQALATVRAA